LNDDWTPAHLTGGATNLYKEMDLALKGEEWRQPGLVALAAKLATSAGEHKPIKVEVPASYEPKAGANPWADVGGAACTGSQALPEPVEAADAAAAHENRMSLGAAAAVVAPPPKPAPPPRRPQEVELGSMPPQAQPAAVARAASGNVLGRARSDSLVDEDDVVFAAMPGPAPAGGMDRPITDIISHRLSGWFGAPKASQRLEA